MIFLAAIAFLRELRSRLEKEVVIDPCLACPFGISYNILNAGRSKFMPRNDSEVQIQARRILDAIAFTPFEQCEPLSRDFSNITPRPGIYAIRNKTDGLLYIGKTKNLRGRFSGGHKAFLWAWLDKYDHRDIRIALQPIYHWKNHTLLLELEAIILRATEPP